MFYLTMECPHCGFLMRKLMATVATVGGHPEVPYDMGAQMTWHCDCGIAWVTGDFEAIDSEEL